MTYYIGKGCTNQAPLSKIYFFLRLLILGVGEAIREG